MARIRLCLLKILPSHVVPSNSFAYFPVVQSHGNLTATHRIAVEDLRFGQQAPTIPVADYNPGKEVQPDTGWMTLLEPDVFGERRRFRAWIRRLYLRLASRLRCREAASFNACTQDDGNRGSDSGRERRLRLISLSMGGTTRA